MPAGKRPVPEDTMTARRVLLDGLARGADIFELVSELAPLHPRNDTFPGEVFLHLAGDALDWCGASRADPLPLAGLCERFLPERAFRGRENTKFQYAVLAAAALHGGTEPDLLEEVAWWHRRLLAEFSRVIQKRPGERYTSTRGRCPATLMAPQSQAWPARSYSTMTTTLPLAWPSPRYRSASGTWLNG
jgi:hypothetical protein